MTKLPVFFFSKWLLSTLTFPQDILLDKQCLHFIVQGESPVSWTKPLKQLVAKRNYPFSTRDTPGNPQTQEPHATLINNHHYLVWWNNHMLCSCKTHSLSLVSMTGWGFLFRYASRHPEVPEVIHVGRHFFSRAHGSLAGTKKMFYKNYKNKRRKSVPNLLNWILSAKITPLCCGCIRQKAVHNFSQFHFLSKSPNLALLHKKSKFTHCLQCL